jgi:hypothetical protein
MDNSREALLKEYSEVSGNFRLLTDIRFKLLGLMPVATVVAAFAATVKGEVSGAAVFLVSLFGLVVVLGLITYSVRNDQLYDELIGRAADIERSLGVRDGSYAFRPYAWLRVGWTIEHGNALALIYGATVAVWLTGVFAPPVAALASLQLVDVEPIERLIAVGRIDAVLLLASIAAVSTTILCGWRARRIEARKRRVLRRCAAEAMQYALNSRLDAQSAAADPHFIDLCARLREGNLLVAAETGVTTQARLRRRAECYASPARAARYLPQQSDRLFAAHLIALLCDLPPRWLLDVESGRRA